MKPFALKSTGAQLPQDVDKALDMSQCPDMTFPCNDGCGHEYCTWCGALVQELKKTVEYQGQKYFQACPNCRPDLFAGLRRDNQGPETSLLSFQPPGPELTPAPDLRRRRYQCPRGHTLWTYRLGPLCSVDGCRAKMREVIE